MKRQHKNHPAFTIVELLIVIVVIGILAAITIVAYNGLQSRARASSASSALSQASKKIAIWQVDNPSTTPTDLATVGVTDGNSVTYQYTAGSSGAYCITATVSTTSYYLSATSTAQGTPTSGGCAGHGQGGVAAVTNLHTNPSFETNTSGWGQSSYATIARVTGSAPAGSAYLRVSRSSTGDAYAYFTTPTVATANTPYVLSFWVWADSNNTLSGSILFRVYDSGSCCINLASSNSLAVTTTPSRVVLSGMSPSNPTTGLQIILRVTANNGENVYYDGFMVTQGSTAYNFADGNSANWTWNSATNNSTSTGPPL